MTMSGHQTCDIQFFLTDISVCSENTFATREKNRTSVNTHAVFTSLDHLIE